MTDKNSLVELAERCEQATGPSRELDEIIRAAVFAPADAWVKQSPFNGEWCVYEKTRSGKERAWEASGVPRGHFTASLDAAITLVPEGFKLRGFAECDRSEGGTYWHASLVAYPNPPGFPDPRKIGDATTGPLALCAAALRAIATQGEG